MKKIREVFKRENILDEKRDKTVIKKEMPEGVFEKNIEQKKDKIENYCSFYCRRTVEKKLTIFLVENTSQIINEWDTVLKIIHKFSSKDLICFINYGSTINVGKIHTVHNVKNEKIFDVEDMSYKACLYDSLNVLKQIIDLTYEKTVEIDGLNTKIESIEIVGIGSGKNIGSTIGKKEAMECFSKIRNNKNIDTKYFCFTEEVFTEIAALGFRSIGAFPRK